MDRKVGSILAVAAILVAACNGAVDTTPPTQFEWQTALVGGAGWEHLSGESSVEWTEGLVGFHATARIAGDEEGAVRPWHIHFGTCGTGGGIVGADGDYPRLAVGADGTAQVSIQVAQPLSTATSYHVNVHQSESQMEVIIACGDLHVAAGNPDSDGPDY
jgi:superoxide dismutase, Cu-Zn family